MSSIEEMITLIEKPVNIREALAASGPYPLKVAFEMDKTVQALIKSKGDVEKNILNRLKQSKSKTLDDISKACLCFVLEKRKAKSAVTELSDIISEYKDSAKRDELAFAPFFAINAVKVIENHDDIRADYSYQIEEFESTLQRIKKGR